MAETSRRPASHAAGKNMFPTGGGVSSARRRGVGKRARQGCASRD